MTSRDSADRSTVTGQRRLPPSHHLRVLRTEGAAAAVDAPERLTYSIDEVAEALGISRSTAYECVRRGEIPAVRFGRRVLVVRTVLEGLLSQRFLWDDSGRG